MSRARFVELHRTRIVALFYEQRLEVTGPIRWQWVTPLFGERKFDEVVSGPLWTVFMRVLTP